MSHLQESEYPMKLENLLQVPLEVIKLEDLIKEKSALIARLESRESKECHVYNGDRLCRSADSQPNFDLRNRLNEGRTLQKSLSASCLFDCCAQPSRWKESDKYSNKTTFKTTALKLPDGSSAVVPVMDFSEETLTDVEMQKEDSDDEKIIKRIKSASPNNRETCNEDDERIFHKSNQVARESNEKSEQLISEKKIALSWAEKTKRRPGVVIGKVTENPTRYEDLLLSNANKVIPSSGIVRSNNTVILSREAITSREIADGDKGKSEDVDPDTLKLTFYNDGRKQSEKEFRTGLDGSTNNSSDVGVTAGGGEVDIRCFNNSQGLQLSRVLRDSNPDIHKSTAGGRSTYDNTHSRFHHEKADNFFGNKGENLDRVSSLSSSSLTQSQSSLLSPTINNIRRRNSSDRTWGQYDGLQISRCQREGNNNNNKIISLDGNKADNSRNPSLTQAQNSLLMASENETREAETLIERHLQSYLTSMRYVKPAGENITSPADMSNKNLSRRSSITSSSEISRKSASISLSSGQGGERIPASLQARSPTRDSVMSEGSTQITRVPSAHIISPSHHHHSPSATSPVDIWRERAIARIPARPYLRRNMSCESQPRYETPPQPMTIQGVAAPGLISPPKRYKLATNYSSNPSPGGQFDQPQRRYPTGTNGIIAAGNSAIVGNNMEYQHPPTIHSSTSQQHFPNSQLARTSSYTNIHQQVPRHIRTQMSPCGSRSSPGSSNIISSNNNNIRSPGSLSQIPPQHFRYSSQGNNTNHAHFQQQQLNESIMIAAAAAAANSSEEPPFDNATYYERLRRYWSYYQKQDLDWTKLTEYYQKYRFYPWDILSARDETLLRQWKPQQNDPHQIVGRNSTLHDSGGRGNGRQKMDTESMSQQEQHQLALKAMNAANANLNKTMPPSSYQPSFPQQNRIQRVANVFPPETSPSTTLQGKYNYNSQQLIQMQQRESTYHAQNSHQQEQQQRHFPIPQSLPSPQQTKRLQQVIPMAETYDIRSAYNQLAAAAVAVAVARENQTHLGSDSNRISSSYVKCQSSSMNPSEGNPYTINNIHRQTLELALKNNFRGGLNNAVNNNYELANENRTISKGVSISPPLSHNRQQSSLGWATNINRGGGTTNMRQEPLRTASSPTSAQETAVIRRLQQQLSPQSANITIRKSSFVPHGSGKSNESLETTIASIPYHHRNSGHASNENLSEIGGAQAISLHHRQHQQYPTRTDGCRTLNVNGKSLGGAEHPGILKRRIGGSNGHPVSEKGNLEKGPIDKRTMTAMSPVPLIVGEEEIVTANVSPSAVLASVDIVDEEATLDGNEVVEENDRSDGNGNNEMWQYDHVVLLDKRIKTYMCKRCFETLKTEQQIRNHLFCKMLANHVQCHVCLQLVSTEAYPSHLQVHGVRPPEEESKKPEESIEKQS